MLFDTFEDEERSYLVDDRDHLFASLPDLLEFLRLSLYRFLALAADSVRMVQDTKLPDGFDDPTAMLVRSTDLRCSSTYVSALASFEIPRTSHG